MRSVVQTISCVALLALSISAYAENEGRGGGNVLEGEFKAMARIGHNWAITLRLIDKETAKEWDAKIDSMTVRFTPIPLMQDGRPVDAGNDRIDNVEVYQPKNYTQNGWKTKAEEEQIFLATHESLQLIGKDDGYEISTKVLIAAAEAMKPKPWSCGAQCGGYSRRDYGGDYLDMRSVQAQGQSAAQAFTNMASQCVHYPGGATNILFIGVTDVPVNRLYKGAVAKRLVTATLQNACVKN